MIDIRIGNSLELIKELDDKSIDCVMTSPPYWGLRDYGHSNQLGQEETPEEFINKLVLFFDDVKDKLKDTGTCWINLGDTYAGSGGAGGDYNKGGLRDGQVKYKQGNTGLQSKCACMIPERFAWAMIEHGWVLRNKIIWHKKNGMPESVNDRFTKQYEYLFFFTKQEKYYFDLDVVRILSIHHDKNKKGKNPGDVWTINTKPYSGAHFAVFPIELVKTPILSGCPPKGIVLDPFGGSGTVGEFCRKNDRDCILFELNPEYKKLIQKRTMSETRNILSYNQ